MADSVIKIEIGDNLKSCIGGAKPIVLLIIGLALVLYLMYQGYNPNDIIDLVPKMLAAIVMIVLAYSDKISKQPPTQ